jgi:hypothetical protein
MVVDAQREVLITQSALTANQNALSAIQGSIKSINIIAPFAGTISRKNIAL